MTQSDDLRDQLARSLGSSYAIERELGGGGMSRVFLAEETRFRRRVVVKVLSPDLAAGLSAERFEREIALAAGLQEPHIVPVITAGDVDGLPWYTMPFVEGESLRERMGRGIVPLTDGVNILIDIARALSYAHARGIVHRDIKPENVLLSSGTAVVTDFGIAKALSASRTRAPGGTLTVVGTSLGTPAYMAPEQVAGDDVDARADLYAWGIVAYELLSGRHPFAGKSSSQQLLAAHISERPALLAVRGLPSTVRETVMRCLEKDPTARPAGAAEIIQTLETATPSERSRLAGRWAIGAFVTLAASVAVGAVLASRSGRVRSASSSVPTMLAVLPFEHDGPEDQAPFTNGLTDALTAKLGALPGLAVIDRQSASQYRGTTKPARQIGAELSVPFLVEGVVRWAKTSSGAWRAQVTPTLVDARSGTTKWTGEPVVITPEDPFTAQASIAQRVAEALQVQLRPADRAALSRRQTENPNAFASYQRGRALLDASGAGQILVLRRAVEQFERAAELDPSFAEAWGHLAGTQLQIAINSADRDAELRMRRVFELARAHAPNDPVLLQSIAYMKLFFDRDTAGVDDLVRRSLETGGNDPAVLGVGSLFLAYRQQRFDSAYVLATRAARLDPRSPSAIGGAVGLATLTRRWADARRYAEMIIALDSTSDQGWWSRAQVELYDGDTVALHRELTRALAHLSHPGVNLLTLLAYGTTADARRFVGLRLAELRPLRLADTVINVHDAKADAFLRLGDAAGARAQYDSIRVMLTGRSVVGFFERPMLFYLAYAQSALGQPAAARVLLNRAIGVAGQSSDRAGLFGVIAPDVVAGTYARLGEPGKAVAWLENAVNARGAAWTARGLANRPKLFVLRGTPAFERFLRDHSQ